MKKLICLGLSILDISKIAILWLCDYIKRKYGNHAVLCYMNTIVSDLKDIGKQDLISLTMKKTLSTGENKKGLN